MTVRILCLAVLLSTATFVMGQGAKSPAMRYLEEGSAHYIRHDYKKAIGPYSKALELEKKQPTLDKAMWRVLIDNLGMAYGISGDLAKATETFEYGLSKDPNYPMFYYNLACTYGEMNDVDKAIANLKLAYQHKDQANAGEPMPDPATDSSFKRFLGNERFRQALREIEQANQSAPQPDRLTITERPDVYELAVPVSRVVMTIPKKGLTQKESSPADANASPRYFYLQDTAAHVILSGWFESQDIFPGAVKFWETETAAWSRAKLAKPINVTFKKIGGWDAVVYQISPAAGAGSHIRAHWVQAGTWIDIHLSSHGEGSTEEKTASLVALLGKIRVSEK
jgi:tetratricopeptide (TPR) repeat protein